MAKGFNWFDILIVALLVWGHYSAKKSDFISELFKLTGIFITTFIAVHYFFKLGHMCGEFFFVPPKYRDGVAFLILVSGVYGLFFIMAKGWLDLLKVKCPLFLDRWGSLCVAWIKSFLFCGLIYLLVVMLLQGTFARGAQSSFSSRYISLTSTKIYEKIFARCIFPFFSSEKFNKRIFRYVPKNKFDVKPLLRE